MARKNIPEKADRRSATSISPRNLYGCGPGSLDYVTERFKGVPLPGGPLIDPYALMPAGSTKGSIEKIFDEYQNPPAITPQEGPSSFAQYAALEPTTRTDAMATAPAPKKQTSTPKGDMQAPSTDPFSMMMDAFMDLLSGGTPNPMMGGGTTVQPKSPFTEMPSEMYSGVSDPMMDAMGDQGMSQIAQALDPNAWAPQNAAPAQPPAPMPARRPMSAPPSSAPPMPEMNPAFHNDPNDMRTIGMMLQQMFNPQPAGIPPTPSPAPLPRGGV